MLSAFVIMLLAVDDPTPPIPPKHPDEPVVEAPAKKELAGGTAKATVDAKPEPKKEPAKHAEPAPAKKETEKVDPLAAMMSADAGVDQRTDANPPPSITSSALCEELKKSALAKKAALSKIEEERKALAAERAKLEATALEIAKAREQLKLETERLQELIEESRGLKPSATKSSASAAASGNVAGLAKTMKSMKPEQAAQLVTKMDARLAAQVLQHMSPKDSGAVLAHVKPDVAADLMASLAALPPAAKDKKR